MNRSITEMEDSSKYNKKVEEILQQCPPGSRVLSVDFVKRKEDEKERKQEKRKKEKEKSEIIKEIKMMENRISKRIMESKSKKEDVLTESQVDSEEKFEKREYIEFAKRIAKGELTTKETEWMKEGGIEVVKRKKKEDFFEVVLRTSEQGQISYFDEFIREKCVILQGSRIKAKDFHDSYFEWMKKTNPGVCPMPKPLIKETLKNKYNIKRTLLDGYSFYKSIKLLES